MAQYGSLINNNTAFDNVITKLFGIELPIIQAGMIWASGWKLASAVSNAGGLGLLGAGSMYPAVLEEHILKCKDATNKPFGVNLPLLYPDIHAHISTIIKHKVPIVFTSAGNPKTYTSLLKDNGIKVVHVVSSSKFAIKSEEAGVDAVVAEGFEAGGHNGREETTTMCLIPGVSNAISIPLIAAGGIACGKSMLAAMVLGADAVQIGSRYVCTPEASSHINFKNAIVAANEGDTELMMKQLTPVRLLKNEFYNKIKTAELSCKSNEEVLEILGRGKAKAGMFLGDNINGELEIGQVSAGIRDIMSAGELTQLIWRDFVNAGSKLFS
jgi:enoyl-[acyl-carrier protein] reductase II